MNEQRQAILQVKQLTVSFDTDGVRTKAVSDLSFDLWKGETLAIVGESGSGKSVSSLAIMCLLPCPPAVVESGAIIFDGVNVLEKNQAERFRGKRIAMIFQEPMTSLNPLMTCGLQVAEALQLHMRLSFKDAKTQTINLFNEVQIPFPEKTFNKYPHELSGGQKQRVMIAMALSCNPDIIIADEPTTALDVMVQASILDLLKQLQNKYGLSLLFITHDLGLVRHFADSTLVMYKGKLVESGPTQELFTRPQQNYTKALLHCRPDAQIRLKQLPLVADFEQNKPIVQTIITENDFRQKLERLQQAENILEIQHLYLQYVTQKNKLGKALSYFEALRDINLFLKKGETLGLVGESGCGKTSLGKTIVKLEKYSAGKILFKGQDIYGADALFKKQYPQKVQIIYQDPYSSLNPRISIGEAIKEALDYYSIGEKNTRKQHVCELLEKVGLEATHYNRYPHEFSGGQRQRISIARCLALQPELIICDESVSALDISVQAQVLNLLSDLRDEFNLSLLFISHDLNVVHHFCDRIAVMQKGQIVELNNTIDLFADARQDYTKQLLKLVH